MTSKRFIFQAFTTAIAVSLTFILYSCSHTKKSDSVEVISLTATEPQISGEELILGSPGLLKVGDYLVISDFKGDSVITVVDTRTMTNKGSFLTYGQGPGEFQKITLKAPIPDNNNEFIIVEPTIRKLTRFSLNGIDDGKLSPVDVKKLDCDMWQFLPLANGNYVASLGYDEHTELLTVYSKDGELIGRVGDRPMPDKYKGEAPIDITAAYQFILHPSPDGRHVVAVGDGVSAVFYELIDDGLVEKATIFDATADPERSFTANGYMGIEGNTDIPMGFCNAAAGDDGVYILYTDRPIAHDEFNAGNKIFHYDYDGNLKREFNLDKRISRLCAPDSDGIMYAIALDDCEPTIVTFDTK